MAPPGPAAVSPASYAVPSTPEPASNLLAPEVAEKWLIRSLRSAENTTDHGFSGGSAHPEYIAFFLIPVFFVMGLLGILICHVLKKKGYRCTTEAEQEEKLEEKIELNETINDNGDTVGQIVDYIMKNEANADILKAMVTDTSVYDPERFRVTKVGQKSNSKERKNVSVSGMDANGAVPATPVKESLKGVTVTPAVKQESEGLHSTPTKERQTARSHSE